MKNVDLLFKNVDLIWAEGSLYSIGFENSLNICSKALKKEGALVCSELTLTAEENSEQVLEYFKDAYPDIKTIAENRELLKKYGFTVLSDFTLPSSDFLENFYNPLEERMAKLKKEDADDKALLEFIEAVQSEIDFYRENKEEFSYQMYICVKN